MREKDMNLENLESLINDYKNKLEASQEINEVVKFLGLLFNPGEVIQVKDRLKLTPLQASYFTLEEITALAPRFLGLVSKDGARYCSNPIPDRFIGQISEIDKYQSMGERVSEALAESLASKLSLTADLFPKGRTFFIEADNDAEGRSIETQEQKSKVLHDLLSTGVPFSYVVDTGGRGPHIGIVLHDDIPLEEFNRLVIAVQSRLPSWLDTGVGKVNQLGRFPGTYRTNKKGHEVQVKTIHVGKRVPNEVLNAWLDSNPIINSSIKAATRTNENHAPAFTDDELEKAAWDYVAFHALKHASFRNGKIRVACPEGFKHKSGRDKDMDAFINVATGLVYCQACGKKVGETFRSKWTPIRHDSVLIPTVDDLGEFEKTEIKVGRLF
jgi:hypothetical protein